MITNWYRTMEEALRWWNLLLVVAGENGIELPQPFVDARAKFDEVTLEHFV